MQELKSRCLILVQAKAHTHIENSSDDAMYTHTTYNSIIDYNELGYFND